MDGEMQNTQERFSAKAKGAAFALLHFSNTCSVRKMAARPTARDGGNADFAWSKNRLRAAEPLNKSEVPYFNYLRRSVRFAAGL